MKSQGYELLGRDAYINKRNELIQQKLNYLEDAAHKVSIRAISMLASMHYSQNYGDNGLIKASAYNNTILELTDDNELYNRVYWSQQRLSKRLNPQDIEQATRLSEQLISNIKDNGTLNRYVNN